MTEHRRWWRNPTFWIALLVPPTISYFAAQMGSNRAIEQKQAAFEITTNNLSDQFKAMRSEFASLSTRIDSRLGDIGYVKAQVETEKAQIADLQGENRLLRGRVDELAQLVASWGAHIAEVRAKMGLTTSTKREKERQ